MLNMYTGKSDSAVRVPLCLQYKHTADYLGEFPATGKNFQDVQLMGELVYLL
jgi:hypothetical protein